MIAACPLFWLLSGLIPLLALETTPRATSCRSCREAAATALTLATCLIDIALGAAVLVRPLARRRPSRHACRVARLSRRRQPARTRTLARSARALVKVLPSILLTLVALAILDER